MIEYLTNPNRRCMYCKGREVIKMEGELILDVNLELINGLFRCKDQKECQQNIEGENTGITFGVGEDCKLKEFKIIEKGTTIFEAKKE